MASLVVLGLAMTGSAAAVLSGALTSVGPQPAAVAESGCPPSTSSTTTPAGTPTTAAPGSKGAQALGPLVLAATTQTTVLSTATFTPVPTGMTPTDGLPTGGTSLTITGTGFGSPGNDKVWVVFYFPNSPSELGPILNVNSTVIDSTTIFVPSTPPEQYGIAVADVWLATPKSFEETTTNPWAAYNFIPVSTFTYTFNPTTTTTTNPASTTTSTTSTIPPIPNVDALAPPVGSPQGGTPVSIGGNNFTGATSVTFGGVPAISFQVIAGGLIEAEAPAGTGTVDVVVTTPGGSSPVTSSDKFTFTTALPAIVRPKPGC